MKKRILLLMLLMLTVLAIGVLASSCVGGKLTAPTDIRYENGSIIWSPVEGAEKYHVLVDGQSEKSTLGTSYAHPNATEQFTVRITAVAEGKDPASATHTFIPLDTVKEVRVADDGTLSWDPVAEAGAYVLKVDGTDITVYNTEYSGLEAGAHSVQVRADATAVGEGISYFSKFSDPKSVTICADVNSDTITYDPTNMELTWGSVSGASAYRVSISGGGLSIEETVEGTSYSFDAEMRNFTVRIRAIGNHSSTFDSKGEAEKTMVYLRPVTNLRVVDGELLWDGSEGADAYRLSVNGKQQAQLLTECKATGFPANQTITVSILPVSDDTVYFSSWSADFSFRILPSPVLQWNNLALDGDASNNIFWDAVASAGGYEVRVTFNGEEIDGEQLPTDVHAYANAYTEAGTYEVSVKSTASIGASDVSDSTYSAPIRIIRLPAPKFASGKPITSDPNDVTKGFTVTFTPVSGATQYRIWKDNADYATVSGATTQYTDTAVLEASVITAQQYNYKIQSIGRGIRSEANGVQSVILDSLTASSLSFVIDVLPAPTNPRMEGFALKYDAVVGVNGYVISTGSATYNSNTNSYTLDSLAAGAYSVSVCARGNGESTLSSNYTPAISVTRLAAPTDIRIMTDVGDDGKLVFEEVANSRSYNLVIRGIAEPIQINYKTNIKSYIKTDGTYLHLVAVANYYQDDDVSTRTYYMTSRDSETRMFTKLAMPTFGEKPFAGGMLNWNAPSNVRTADYTPTYKVYNAQTILQNVTMNGTSMSLSTLEAGDYSFKVMAIGDGINYINSDLNTDTPTKTVTKLASPNVKIDRVNNVYTWTAVPSAQNYAVYVDGVLAKTDYNMAGGVFTFTPSFTMDKEYRVTFIAIGDGGIEYIDSSETLIIQTTDILDPPTFAWSYGAAQYTPGAKLTLTVTEAPALATGFCYGFNGTVYHSEEFTMTQSMHASGTFECTVYARGGAFDEAGVYWLDSPASSIEIYLLDEPGRADIDAYGTMTWGASGNAAAYELKLVYNGKTYNARVSNAKCNILEILGLTKLPTSGKLKIEIYAVGTENCIPSTTHTQDWAFG